MDSTECVDGGQLEEDRVPPLPVFRGGTGPRPGIDLCSNAALYAAMDEDFDLEND